jgi:excisionase family DNA binding protein
MTVRRERTRYFTTEEVARILSVRPKTVRRWIRHGHMTAVRLHRQWRIAEKEIQRVLEVGRDG